MAQPDTTHLDKILRLAASMPHGPDGKFITPGTSVRDTSPSITNLVDKLQGPPVIPAPGAKDAQAIRLGKTRPDAMKPASDMWPGSVIARQGDTSTYRVIDAAHGPKVSKLILQDAETGKRQNAVFPRNTLFKYWLGYKGQRKGSNNG